MEEFWAALNITSSAIPNEMLLRLYDYHGLRHAIYKQGGYAKYDLVSLWPDAVCLLLLPSHPLTYTYMMS